MQIPAFMKTIRFRLTLWYSGILVLLMVVLLFGINMAMIGSRPEIPPEPGDIQSWREHILEERTRNMNDLRNYSLIGAGVILVVGAVGGYVISGKMLKPIDNVSSLASRISHTNLKERINNEGPEDEIKRLSGTFDEMLQRLDSAFESQKQFIQDASHELKTPIATAQTNIEVLEMDQNATIDDYKNVTEVVKRSLDRLKNLSQSLSLLSQGNQTADAWAEVDLAPLVEEVVAEAEPIANAAGIDLEAEIQADDTRLKGDAVRIKQVLTNLVDNAIKYNHPQGTVRVSTKSEGPNVIIEVADTGIGIAETEQERIFDRFYRVDKSRSRAQGGSGLGLAIARKIVEEHGGAISVKSSLGQGSTFLVSLPRLD